MRFTMCHENYNVSNMNVSIAFYREALGLSVKSQKTGDGFLIDYLGNDANDFLLELTELKDHPQAYDLGECEFHLAFSVKEFEAAHRKHAFTSSKILMVIGWKLFPSRSDLSLCQKRFLSLKHSLLVYTEGSGMPFLSHFI